MIAITEIDLPNTLEHIPKPVSSISPKYANLVHVFLEDAANKLPEHGNHNLQLETTKTPPFKSLYNLSQNKLEVLQEYIADNLAKGFIQLSTSSAGALVLFIKKKDRDLCLYVDY